LQCARLMCKTYSTPAFSLYARYLWVVIVHFTHTHTHIHTHTLTHAKRQDTWHSHYTCCILCARHAHPDCRDMYCTHTAYTHMSCAHYAHVGLQGNSNGPLHGSSMMNSGGGGLHSSNSSAAATQQQQQQQQQTG